MHVKIFLIIMVVLVIATLNTPKLRRAVIYLGLFSLISSFTYLIYGAPDVAIAEAVIGSGIATVLYLVAIKRYQVFTIFYIQNTDWEQTDTAEKREAVRLKKNIEALLIKKELEPQTIYTKEEADFVLTHKEYDLLIEQKNKDVVIYGFPEDYHLDDIEKMLSTNQYKNLSISIIRYDKGVISSAQMD